MTKSVPEGQICPACQEQEQNYMVLGGLPFFICPGCGNVFVPAGDLQRMKKVIKEQQPKIVKPSLKIVH